MSSVKAAVVSGPGRTPAYGEFDAPEPREGFELVRVGASALTNVTRARASGTHYSGKAGFPFVAGVDGVGTTLDGRRVAFLLPDLPYGAMAEITRVDRSFTVPVPDGLDDVLAAALVNPGMAPIAALRERADFAPGQTVLVHGATGTTGSLAVQIAKRLGARRVIATGRNREALDRLRTVGADEVISLTEDPDTLHAGLAGEFRDGDGVDIVLDYLAGAPSERLLAILASLHRRPTTLRYILSGGAAGTPHVTIQSAWLASSRIDVRASGIGSVTFPALVRAAGEALQIAADAGLEVPHTSIPLRQVEAAWNDNHGRDRVVFTIS